MFFLAFKLIFAVGGLSSNVLLNSPEFGVLQQSLSGPHLLVVLSFRKCSGWGIGGGGGTILF